MTSRVEIEFDIHQLSSYSDSYLSFLWHLAQHNPAPHGDYHAGEAASKIGFEIIRRWLRKVEPEMYHHQQRDNYWSALTKLAKYEPPEGVRSAEDGWHEGRWVVKDKAVEQKALAAQVQKYSQKPEGLE